MSAIFEFSEIHLVDSAAAAAAAAAAIIRAFGDPDTGVYLDRHQTHAVMPHASGLVSA